MKSYKLILFASLHFASSVADADFCEPVSCTQGFKEVSVCFIDPVSAYDPLNWAVYQLTCGIDSQKFVINESNEFKSAFEMLRASCARIKEITFYGHGSPNYHGAGKINRDVVKQFKEYSCMVTPKAKILLSGCNTGRGCQGAAFMYRLAEALLSKGGEVEAPTNYQNALLTEVGIRARHRILSWNPSGHPKDKWRFDRGSNDGNVNPSPECTSDQLSVLDNYSDALKRTEVNKSCAHKVSRHGPVMAAELRKQIDKANVGNVADAADATRTQMMSTSLLTWGALGTIEAETVEIEQCLGPPPSRAPELLRSKIRRSNNTVK